MAICFLSGFCFATVFLQQIAGIPLPPVQCRDGNHDCTVRSAYGTWPDRSTCKASLVMYPSTETELINSVAFGVREKMKMKVVSRWAHSIPKLVCPDGSSGLIISTRDFNKNILVDPNSMSAVVDGGVELGELVDTLARSGLALPHSPYWNGLSIAGLIATGAHGSSLFGKGSAVHEYVSGIKLVVPASAKEGYAKVLNISPAQEDYLNAAKVALGVLGVVSQVTLSLQPMFKRSITNHLKSDLGIEDQIVEFGYANEYGDITWYPSQKKAVYRIDNRVPAETPGNGANTFLGFRPTSSAIVKTLRTTEELYEATQNPSGKCISAALQIASLYSIGTGLINGLIFTGYPVIGYQNRLQTSGSCQNSSLPFFLCPWDPQVHGQFFHQTTVSISINKIRDFILDVKKLRDEKSNRLCGVDLYNGFLMRYVRKSSAYLGNTEDAVDVDITYYRADGPTSPRLNEDVLEEIEQMAVFKYQGLPHWGKNRNVAFLGAADKYPNLGKFMEIKHRLDPQGFFSSEWSNAVLGIEPEKLIVQKDHCALEGLCICSEDRHCAPKKRYYCRAGKVFRNAHVCRYE